MKKKYNDGGNIGKGVSDAMKKEPETSKMKGADKPKSYDEVRQSERKEYEKDIEKHGLKGRVSRKSQEEHSDYLQGYSSGLQYGKANFMQKGDAKKNTLFSATEEKLQKLIGSKKSHEGFKKGIEDMDAALKGQGAYKKGGKVKKMAKGGSVKKCSCDGIAVRGKTRAR
jgi:hypothetical protein